MGLVGMMGLIPTIRAKLPGNFSHVIKDKPIIPTKPIGDESTGSLALGVLLARRSPSARPVRRGRGEGGGA